MNPDKFAKNIVGLVGPELTPQESLAVRAVARHESNYGAGWGKGLSTAGEGSNNWGAITMSCDSEGPKFVHKDSRFDSKLGQVVTYETCFRAYAMPEDGALHLIEVLLKPNARAAANRGNLYAFATAMRDNNYYLGTASTRKGQIDAYYKALRRNVDRIVTNTGEPDGFKGGTGLFSATAKGGGLGFPLLLGVVGIGAVLLLGRA